MTRRISPPYQANSHIIVTEYFLPWFFLGSVSVNQHPGFDSKMSNFHRQFNELQQYPLFEPPNGGQTRFSPNMRAL
jgi:hypothetical protein